MRPRPWPEQRKGRPLLRCWQGTRRAPRRRSPAWRRGPQCTRRPLLLLLHATVLLLALAAPPAVHGQGLIAAPAPVGATDDRATVYAAYTRQVSQLSDWRQRFQQPQGGKQPAGAGGGVVMGASGGADADAQLFLATVPQAYSAADTRWTGGKRVVPTARDQRPCDTCVAHALLGAARAAVASRTGLDVELELDAPSIQDFYFCSAGDRECDTGWTLRDGLEALALRGPQLLRDECLPYDTTPRFDEDRDSVCVAPRKCTDVWRVASQGTFEYKQLTQVWQVMAHIIENGAVVSRFDISSDFVPFFSDPRNARTPYSPSPNAKFAASHAVLLIGFTWGPGGGVWRVRNSFGTSFADGGDFQVPFGAAATLSASDTYGVRWWPKANPALAAQLRMQPDPKVPGCFTYKAVAGDLLPKLAWRAGVPLSRLAADNPAAVLAVASVGGAQAPSLAGTTLRICNPQLTGARAGPPAPAPAPPAPPASPPAAGPPGARAAVLGLCCRDDELVPCVSDGGVVLFADTVEKLTWDYVTGNGGHTWILWDNTGYHSAADRPHAGTWFASAAGARGGWVRAESSECPNSRTRMYLIFSPTDASQLYLEADCAGMGDRSKGFVYIDRLWWHRCGSGGGIPACSADGAEQVAPPQGAAPGPFEARLRDAVGFVDYERGPASCRSSAPHGCVGTTSGAPICTIKGTAAF